MLIDKNIREPFYPLSGVIALEVSPKKKREGKWCVWCCFFPCVLALFASQGPRLVLYSAEMNSPSSNCQVAFFSRPGDDLETSSESSNRSDSSAEVFEAPEELPSGECPVSGSPTTSTPTLDDTGSSSSAATEEFQRYNDGFRSFFPRVPNAKRPKLEAPKHTNGGKFTV